jgi:hypothetical protein
VYKAHSSHGDHKGRVVGALYNIIVKLDDLLDTGDWQLVSRLLTSSSVESRLYVLGRALCPVISSGSATFFGDIVTVVTQDKIDCDFRQP